MMAGSVRVGAGWRVGLIVQRVALRLFLMVLLPMSLMPPSLVAQDTQDATEESEPSSWRVAIWAYGAHGYTFGNLAKNAASDIPSLATLETVFEMGAASLVGTGVELFLPGGQFSVRLGWESSFGAEATGQVAICSLLQGSLCKTETAAATVQGAMVAIRSAQGEAGQRIRPVVSLLAGMRWYSFEIPECTGLTGDPHLVCGAIADLFRDPEAHTFLRAGVGLQARSGPVRVEVGIEGGASRYEGGTDRTSGNWYQDLRLQSSASLFVF